MSELKEFPFRGGKPRNSGEYVECLTEDCSLERKAPTQPLTRWGWIVAKVERRNGYPAGTAASQLQSST